MLSIGKSGGLLVLTAVISLLMIVMGTWQLSRADEKRLLLLEWHQRHDLELTLNEALSIQAPFGYQLAVNGLFLAGGDVWLDNQIESGRVGYRLIRPLQTRHGLLAVDTGWWPANPDRRQLPVTKPLISNQSPAQLTGHLVRPYVVPLTLAEVSFNPSHPLVANLQPVELAQIWGESVLPFVLKVGAEQGDWKPVVMGPERHTGYAVQWFAMTLAVWLAAAWYYRRQHDGT
ncbi:MULTISPECIES: SURF1 family protein [Oceanisphaera]|uniref:SURF1-like protein n=1 Tax=Oceanisphaera ostreae TaxID=914151 RepID=A0ABW3KFT3_9GAMM